ncbi:MAG: hypothetical protein IJC46_03455 [Clostridia bacterium]|nr:hypothetical protein [Clostridia bacterium]
MYKAKHQNNNAVTKAGTKVGALLIAVVLLLGGAVGGTVAWLITQTDAVTNTFTYGDIDITLVETDTQLDNDGDANTNTYKMMPGSDITKDPIITVLEGSEACYLFVKVEESADPKFDDFMTYTIATGWTQLKDDNGADVAGVFYREVDAVTADTAFHVLTDDKVTVLESVTKNMLNALDPAKLPTLTFTGYAVQQENIDTAYAAWTEIA